jgi:hypothetical protein
LLSPNGKPADSRDPYELDDAMRSGLEKLEDKFGHQNKSAKTVMKRNHGPGVITPMKVFDFAADPVNLGIRPSTAI